MSTPPRKKLHPRGRIGKAVPIQPMDFEAKKQPFVQTKRSVADLRTAITLVGALVILLLIWRTFEFISGL